MFAKHSEIHNIKGKQTKQVLLYLAVARSSKSHYIPLYLPFSWQKYSILNYPFLRSSFWTFFIFFIWKAWCYFPDNETFHNTNLPVPGSDYFYCDCKSSSVTASMRGVLTWVWVCVLLSFTNMCPNIVKMCINLCDTSQIWLQSHILYFYCNKMSMTQ